MESPSRGSDEAAGHSAGVLAGAGAHLQHSLPPRPASFLATLARMVQAQCLLGQELLRCLLGPGFSPEHQGV